MLYILKFRVWPQNGPDGNPRKRINGRPGSVDAKGGAGGVSKYPEPKNGSPADFLTDFAGGSTTPEGSSGAGADSPNSSGGDPKTVPDGSGSSGGSISGAGAAPDDTAASGGKPSNIFQFLIVRMCFYN